MSIPEGAEEYKIGGKIGSRAGESRLVYGAMLLLTGTLCFGLGTLAARHNRPAGDTLWIEQLPPEELPGSISADSSAIGRGNVPEEAAEAAPGGGPAAAGAASATDASSGAYVASKNGTRYYLPRCGGVSRIKEENKVWFATKSEAEAAGYTPAANCDGI